MPLRTLFPWLALYRAGGYDRLREAKRSGRPRKVSGEVRQWLYAAITLGDPRQCPCDFCRWTLGMIRTRLKQQHGIKLSTSGVSRLLRHLGLRPQVPEYKCYRQDPKALRRYLRRTFPALVGEAKRTGAVIYVVAEAAVRADAHQGTTGAPVGETPVVEDSGDCFGLKLISAVSPMCDLKCAIFEVRMNCERFAQFILNLRRDAGRPIIVIANNAKDHREGAVKRYLPPTEEGILVAHLPSYSPELNPDEQVWNHLKRRFGKWFLEFKAHLQDAVRHTMLSIQQSIAFVRSFFALEDTRYAASAR